MSPNTPQSYINLVRFLCFALILGLVGCSTNYSSRSAPSSSEPTTGPEYLQRAPGAHPIRGLEYRLKAATLFIRSKQTLEAQHALREIDLNALTIDPELRKSILQARLALIKNDLVRADELIQSVIKTLPVVPRTPGGNQRIALILPSKGPHAEAAKTIRDGFLAAYYKTLQNQASDHSVKMYDSGSGHDIEEAYQKAVAEHPSIIVGPLTKPEVQAIANKHLTIPVIALNTVTANRTESNQLYQFGLMPEDEVAAVSKQALRHGHRKALILAPHNEWGHRLTTTFKQHWNAGGGTIVDEKFITPTQDLAGKIRTLLKVNGNARRGDVDMLFLVAAADLARQIKPLLNQYSAEDLPVYSTSAIYGGVPAPTTDQDLNGVYFCDMPWILENSTRIQENRGSVAKLAQPQNTRFFALGMDAFQLATHLGNASALPTVGISGLTGQLYLNAYQRIQRGLVCAKFEQGIPVPE